MKLVISMIVVVAILIYLWCYHTEGYRDVHDRIVKHYFLWDWDTYEKGDTPSP